MKTKTFKWNWSSGKVLLLGMLMAVICFLPFLLSEQGFFVYFGDYNMQQLPFYTLVHRAIREGNLFLSLTTDLGSSIYSNYSFYLLGSPFFWITMLFPEAALPYLMPILLMLKLGLAAMFAFLFMRRHVAKPQTACIGALLYAFCGFQIMNIVFNHFLDVTVFFPLYLILLENLLDQKKRGWFALGTAFMVLLNYYFFVGQAFFIMLYVFIRYILPNKGCKLKERIGIVVRVLVEGGIGVLAASAFWLPSILSIMGTSRATEFVFGANAVYYSKWELYAGLLKSLFLPPDLIQETTLFSTSEGAVASVSLFLPLFAVTGVVAFFFLKRKEKWLKWLLIVCGICMVIPVLNSMFSAFNATYYARWFYMPLLFMALATAISLENFEQRAFSKGMLAYVIGYLLLVILGIASHATSSSSFCGELIVGGVCLVMLPYFIWIQNKDRKGKYLNAMLVGTVLVSMLVMYVHLSAGSQLVADYSRRNFQEQVTDTTEFSMLEKDDFYRVEMDSISVNYSMFWDLPSISCFSSTVAPGSIEFYDFIGVERNVKSELPYDRIGARSLLSSRYFLQNETQNTRLEFEKGRMVSFYEKLGKEKGFGIYENESALKMGCVFSYYMRQEEYNKLTAEEKDLALVFVLVPTEGQMIPNIPEITASEFVKRKWNMLENFQNQCEQLNATAAEEMSSGSDFIHFKLSGENEGMLFVSVPYSEGFSAKVDGNDATIQKIDGGLMAVPIKKGDQLVDFSYQEPGLQMGLWISGFGVLLLIGLFVRLSRRPLKKE